MGKTLISMAAFGIFALSASAEALPMIAAGSEISIAGTDTFDATTINFQTPAGLGGTSGSFTELGTAPPVPICATCVTMETAPFTAAFSGQLFSATNMGNTATLDITPPSMFSFTAGAIPSLNVTGEGTLSLTGFAPTPGTFDITSQGVNGIQTTFSASALGVPVPEPSGLSVLVIGIGAVLGMFYFRRRDEA